MKFLKSLSVLVLAFLFLVACQPNKSKHRDMIHVYDSENQQIMETSNPEALGWFSDMLDEIEGEDGDEITEEMLVELPADAQINYIYDFGGGKEGSSVRFTTYKNYPLVTISNIPAVPEVTLELSDLEADELNHPNTWIK
ncbi:hypothetical protein C4K46_04390 [Streptococcus oricebi]|uniref:Lipoprotein n=2 Tax=Streptococcus oricebi TaxID=1547447 RepID=A0ABS5B2W2_9STRE|nr:hypothetical protein [Streptococcus oricebi]